MKGSTSLRRPTSGWGDDYTVTVMLDGMVFQASPTLNVVQTGTGTTPVFVVASGGAPGDAAVEFELSTGTVDATSGVVRLVADFAVSAEGGTATLTMANPSLQGTTSATHGPTNVVMMAAALDEKAAAMNATADVAADGFMLFMDGRDTASLGSLQVTVKENHRQASDGMDVDAQEDIMSIGNNEADPPAPNSTVSFSGDFSFASKVFVHGDNDCGALAGDAHANVDAQGELTGDETAASAAGDLRVMEGTGDDAVVTGTTSAVMVETFATDAQHLCIMVDPEADGAMPIPATPEGETYTAMGSYTGIEDAAIGPMPEEQTLGTIRRNGVTIRIPYITTYSGYNQRLVIVNRGSQARYGNRVRAGRRNHGQRFGGRHVAVRNLDDADAGHRDAKRRFPHCRVRHRGGAAALDRCRHRHGQQFRRLHRHRGLHGRLARQTSLLGAKNGKGGFGPPFLCARPFHRAGPGWNAGRPPGRFSEPSTARR